MNLEAIKVVMDEKIKKFTRKLMIVDSLKLAIIIIGSALLGYYCTNIKIAAIYVIILCLLNQIVFNRVKNYIMKLEYKKIEKFYKSVTKEDDLISLKDYCNEKLNKL